jgi:hypothetical protein
MTKGFVLRNDHSLVRCLHGAGQIVSKCESVGCPALRPLGIGPGPGVGQVVAGVQVSAWSVPSTYQSAGPLGDCGADSNKSML